MKSLLVILSLACLTGAYNLSDWVGTWNFTQASAAGVTMTTYLEYCCVQGSVIFCSYVTGTEQMTLSYGGALATGRWLSDVVVEVNRGYTMYQMIAPGVLDGWYNDDTTGAGARVHQGMTRISSTAPDPAYCQIQDENPTETIEGRYGTPGRYIDICVQDDGTTLHSYDGFGVGWATGHATLDRQHTTETWWDDTGKGQLATTRLNSTHMISCYWCNMDFKPEGEYACKAVPYVGATTLANCIRNQPAPSAAPRVTVGLTAVLALSVCLFLLL